MIQKNSMLALFKRPELVECNPLSDSAVGTPSHGRKVIIVTLPRQNTFSIKRQFSSAAAHGACYELLAVAVQIVERSSLCKSKADEEQISSELQDGFVETQLKEDGTLQ
jgi:hypothetical protein